MNEKFFYKIQVSSIDFITEEAFCDIGFVYDNLDDVKSAFSDMVNNAKKNLDYRSAPETTYRIVACPVPAWKELARMTFLRKEP